MRQQKDEENINILLLNPDWTKRAHPMLYVLSGGHKAKAAEWFLEVHRVLNDIYRSFVVLENFLNREGKDLYIGENKDRIEISDSEKIWVFGFMVDNAYLRIGFCLDKIAQMVRIYYEHPDHGGLLDIYPQCGKCSPKKMNEANCTFGALVSTLRRQGRDLVIDQALFNLENNETLGDVKKIRNDIAHRINSGVFADQGINPKVELEVNGIQQKTTFSFDSEKTDLNSYRIIIAEAHNKIVEELNVIGPKIFP